MYSALFPSSNAGYLFSTLVCIAISAAVHRDYKLPIRAIYAGFILCLSSFFSPISFPVKFYLELNSSSWFVTNFGPFTTLIRAILYALTIFVLKKYSLDSFKSTNKISLWFLGIILFTGYILDVVAFLLNDMASAAVFSIHFFLCLTLLVLNFLAYLLTYHLNKGYEENYQLIKENSDINNEVEMLRTYETCYNQIRAVKHDIEDHFDLINIPTTSQQLDCRMISSIISGPLTLFRINRPMLGVCLVD